MNGIDIGGIITLVGAIAAAVAAAAVKIKDALEAYKALQRSIGAAEVEAHAMNDAIM
jgi:hypothetical protein